MRQEDITAILAAAQSGRLLLNDGRDDPVSLYHIWLVKSISTGVGGGNNELQYYTSDSVNVKTCKPKASLLKVYFTGADNEKKAGWRGKPSDEMYSCKAPAGGRMRSG